MKQDRRKKDLGFKELLKEIAKDLSIYLLKLDIIPKSIKSIKSYTKE